MKTPDEIKKGLENCIASECCDGCPFETDCYEFFSNVPMSKEALAYIQQLEAELEAVKRERDAALYDMKRSQGCICNICKSYYRPDPAVRHYECKIFGKFSEIYENDEGRPFFCGRFEWRGVCPENTEVNTDGSNDPKK